MHQIKSFFSEHIAVKVLSGTVGLLLLILLTVGGVLLLLQTQETDSVAINDAGKLRMLSQRVAKTAFMADETNQDGTAEELRTTIDTFDELLKGLLNGNPDRGLEPAPPSVRSQLDQLQASWTAYKENALRILDISPESSVYEAALDHVAANNATILNEANAAVGQYESIAQAKITRLKVSLYVVLLLSVVLFAGVAWITRRAIQPVTTLSASAERVAGGDLDVTVEVDTEDEVGRLADAFNQMIASIRAGQEQLEAEKASVERKVEEAVHEVETERKYLSESVDTMLGAINEFADGDLTVQLDADRDDDIGRLFHGFNRAVTNVRQMIDRVIEAVSMTSSASDQISSATQQLASGAQEQSVQADEVAAAMEEMSRTIVENAEGATRTAEVAASNGETANENGEVVLQMVDKIRDIGDVVTHSAETVEDLGASSKEIGEIVATIDEIADQTNLLALNAAIEAARAGEHGKGFAVVADEVRELAERTAQATGKIEAMIGSIQSETEEAVSSIQRGREEVEVGINLADRARAAFQEIVDGTSEMANRVSDIAAATEEQSTTSEQISQNVEAISTVSAESAQGVEEIAQSADQLNRLTDDLQSLLNQFTIDAQGHNTTAHRAATPQQS